jgi:hypothetical protein
VEIVWPGALRVRPLRVVLARKVNFYRRNFGLSAYENDLMSGIIYPGLAPKLAPKPLPFLRWKKRWYSVIFVVVAEIFAGQNLWQVMFGIRAKLGSYN